MTASAITTDNAAVVEIASGPSLDSGDQEKTLLTQIIAATTAPNRVRTPIKIKKPAALIRKTTDKLKSPGHACYSSRKRSEGQERHPSGCS
jgi:hypothetical protein